ncbi:UDP-N-acetylglucosamine 1-carboxyvinyltransferase [Candidatus Dependentiae bacterium]|nr:UDP-N-acetylglucosamine 1-carboxyvinyltransferase [Candidatus Dependentiae bacterium]
MNNEYILVESSNSIFGQVDLAGAKNAVLVIMASLILTSGKSILKNVPNSEDVWQMMNLLKQLGAHVNFDFENGKLEVDTSTINKFVVSPEIMKKMRASILVMGPLLARFSKAEVALPGGCILGARPIDFHLKLFKEMGVQISLSGEFLSAHVTKWQAKRLVLEYPSVGATENALMAALAIPGTTQIINAAIEPEVLDLIEILKKMGAQINILPPATIEIKHAAFLNPVEHEIMPDRLEAGSLLLAAAVAGGEIIVEKAPAHHMDVFLMKLKEMGHDVQVLDNVIKFKATKNPQAVSFRTMPHPGFPTDLQAPMLVAQTLAEGQSIIQETVFENRMLHVLELKKMGADISLDGTTAIINGVKQLNAADVNATDIRSSCALVLAGLAAKGQTKISGVHHLRRGYQEFDKKLSKLGAKISIKCY